jgi:transcriptional regulator with XRE-family HTH domain
MKGNPDALAETSVIGAVELRCRREALGLSQQALGCVLGVKQATVSRWEAGRVAPEGLGAEMDQLEAAMAGLVAAADGAARAALAAGSEPAFLVHLSNEEFWRAHPDSDGLPAAMLRVAAARARAALAAEGFRAEILLAG